MSETISREQVLDEIEAAWRPYRERITSLSEDDLLALTDERGWTARDHIDHVTAWEASMTFALRGRPRYEGMGVSAEEYAGDLDALNEAIRAANDEASLAEVLEESARGHREFLAAIRALPEDGLARSYASYVPDAVDGRDEPVLLRVLGNSVEHYPEHLEYIERIVAGRR
jgi:hypothetical protein